MILQEYLKRAKIANVTWEGIIFLSLILITASAAITATVIGFTSFMRSSSQPTSVHENSIKVASFDPEIISQWRIRVLYNNKTKTLSLKNISEITGGLPDYRLAKFSPFSFQILDKTGKELFEKKIIINQFWLEHKNSDVTVAPIEELDSEFFIPYFEQGAKVIIRYDDKTILTIPIPKKSAINLINKSYAQEPVQKERSCGPITAVFISQHYDDNEKDRATFHNLIEEIKRHFKTVPPYNKDFDNFFRFEEVFTTEDLGTFRTERIREIGKQRAPQATKYLLVYKGSGSGGGILPGGVNGYGIGGDITYSQNDPGSHTHEFLGHAVGLLWDRNSYQVFSGSPNPPSNCANNTAGQPFWSKALNANELKITKGCTSNSWYGPTDHETARRTTVMEPGGGVGRFDKVEEYWIENNILPELRSCPGNNNNAQSQNSSCGGWHQTCCADKKCKYEVTVCSDKNTCELCGSLNEPCCNPAQNKVGIACINNLACITNHCCKPGQIWNGNQCAVF